MNNFKQVTKAQKKRKIKPYFVLKIFEKILID